MLPDMLPIRVMAPPSPIPIINFAASLATKNDPSKLIARSY